MISVGHISARLMLVYFTFCGSDCEEKMIEDFNRTCGLVEIVQKPYYCFQNVSKEPKKKNNKKNNIADWKKFLQRIRVGPIGEENYIFFQSGYFRG